MWSLYVTGADALEVPHSTSPPDGGVYILIARCKLSHTIRPDIRADTWISL